VQDYTELSLRVRSLITAHRYRFSAHAERERHSDQITVDEFEQALGTNPEVIENYPTDPRGASYLCRM
jgi:hypothetical protein